MNSIENALEASPPFTAVMCRNRKQPVVAQLRWRRIYDMFCSSSLAVSTARLFLLLANAVLRPMGTPPETDSDPELDIWKIHPESGHETDF
ncbi:unnamed protein product [Arctogadus glacialis]